jgi:TolA-binding protein
MPTNRRVRSLDAGFGRVIIPATNHAGDTPMTSNLPRAIALPVAILTVALTATQSLAQWDGELAPHDRQKLSAYESGALAVAEDLWSKQAYQQASPAYSSFAHEFPKSPAAPYALYRAARALHRQEKWTDAGKTYNEIVDAYPTNVAFASPALFYMGMCEIETGGPARAHQVWNELVDDKDYQRHPLAAEALLRIGDYYRSIKEFNRAAIVDEKLAVGFRTIHPEAARKALGGIVRRHLREPPDVAKIKELYRKCGSFEAAPEKTADDVSRDWTFWTRVADLVRRNGDFPEMWIGPRRDYFSYWAGIFEPLLPQKEDFRADVVNWYLAADRPEEAARATLAGERTAARLAKAADILDKAKKTAEAAALRKELAERFPQNPAAGN